MYFEIGENGKIMVCADAQIKPDMIYLSPPAEFTADEMHDWRIENGAFEYVPLPKPDPQPTAEERIAALEYQNAMLLEQNNILTECVLEMSTILYM